MISAGNKNSLKVKNQIHKLIRLSSENQELKEYLYHFQDTNIKLEQHLKRIESSKIYIYWQKIKFLLKTPYFCFLKAKLRLDLFSININRNLSFFDIINFSVIPYNFRFQRPQQLAKELVKKGHRVFYVENDFIYYANKNDKLTPEIKKVEQNLYTVKLATHSKFTKRKFVYYGEISKEDRLEINDSLNILIKIAYISPKTIIKVDNPPWTCILNKLKLPILYDCLDDHSALEIKAENVEFSEMDLINKSNAIIACSDGLTNRLSMQTSKEIVLIRNACEYDYFAKKTGFEIPDKLKRLAHPIIGYCGAISQRFDEKMLEDIVKEFPDYSFVLIGRLDKPEVAKIAEKYKNIHLLGEIDYQLISAYYQNFDVCFSPYIVDTAAKNLDPVKIYEYLATGKPTVISNISGLYHLKKLIYISRDSKDFCRNIKKALIENNSHLSLQRQQYAKNNTWEIRAAQLESVITKVLKK